MCAANPAGCTRFSRQCRLLNIPHSGDSVNVGFRRISGVERYDLLRQPSQKWSPTMLDQFRNGPIKIVMVKRVRRLIEKTVILRRITRLGDRQTREERTECASMGAATGRKNIETKLGGSYGRIGISA